MKIIHFLKNNFQLVNFFLAILIVGILYGWWYLPNSRKSSIENVNNNNDNIKSEAINRSFDDIKNSNLSAIKTSVSKPNPFEPIITKVPEQATKPLLPELPPESSSQPQESYSPSKNFAVALVKTNLGHFPFAESPQQRLVTVGNYYGRSESLDQEAASAFKKMQADASTQGIKLTIISGFRSISSQEVLFQTQIRRKGGKQAAARFSAPPGHSEHHTGYALDIGDGTNPANDLKVNFEKTATFQWLVNNAPKYGFELSFPPGNRQGVSYEPWHWRYVISPRANRIFMAARSQS